MFASRSDLRDPSPEASTCDLSELDWTQSWDYDLTHVIDDGYGAPTGIDPDVELDLDAELRALLLRRSGPRPTPAAHSPSGPIRRSWSRRPGWSG